MLSYPSTIPLSTRTLKHLADLIRTHRARLRSRWRRLDASEQALLVLAHLSYPRSRGAVATCRRWDSRSWVACPSYYVGVCEMGGGIEPESPQSEQLGGAWRGRGVTFGLRAGFAGGPVETFEFIRLW